MPDGAGDEARTRYLHLGKVTLYQMSYTRVLPAAFEKRQDILYLYIAKMSIVF